MNAQVLEQILKFREERDWKQFHSPKNLAMSIAIEAGELMEIFQWTDLMPPEVVPDADRTRAGEEIADIAIYLALLAHDLNVNLEEAIEHKIKQNSIRYPVREFRGTSRKSDR